MRPFKRLMSREVAMEIIGAKIRRVERAEKVQIEEACGRVLAEDVRARFDVPPFDRASMDGYAVRAGDTYGASSFLPKRLRLIGVQNAGEKFGGEVGREECIQVATGSPMPSGGEAVVMVENTRVSGDFVEVEQPVYPGANISPRGEDIKEGDVVIRKNDLLTPGRIGALAALNITAVGVYVKPSVAVISTGSEVRPLGSDLGAGQIYDINSYTLASIIAANGCTPIRKEIVPDEPEAMRAALSEGVRYDLVVFSGGSSVGTRDLLYDIVEEMGEVLFHGLQVKPGKPTLFGVVGGRSVFGMPGYPTSCLSNAYLFLVPALRIAAGLPSHEPRQVKARLASRFVSSSGREQFLTVRLEGDLAHPVFKKSGAITSMAHADGYIVVPVNVDVVEEGEEVTVTLLG